MKRRLVLISPVPAMATGTGNYLGLLVRDLVKCGATNIYVVANLDQLPESLKSFDQKSLTKRVFKEHADFVSILDYRVYKELDSDLCVFFAANNEYHFHVYSLMERSRVGKRLIVLHEPSCFMIAAHYFSSGFGRSARLCLIGHLKAQYGSSAMAFYQDTYEFGIVESLKYETFGFDWYSFGADKIIVHSEFARLKLRNELKSDHPCPLIVVSDHPDEDVETSNAKSVSCGDTLTFGAFGFINPSKRTYEIISGFAKFVQKIGAQRATQINLKLLLVGKLPSKNFYDPRRHAREQNVEKYVEFFDYVDKHTFSKLIQSCDTIFSLRFPSCGETTGLSAFARPGLNMVVSDYHSFREVGADYIIRPGDDVDGVCDVMTSRYNDIFATDFPIYKDRRASRSRSRNNSMVSVEIVGEINV